MLVSFGVDFRLYRMQSITFVGELNPIILMRQSLSRLAVGRVASWFVFLYVRTPILSLPQCPSRNSPAPGWICVPDLLVFCVTTDSSDGKFPVRYSCVGLSVLVWIYNDRKCFDRLPVFSLRGDLQLPLVLRHGIDWNAMQSMRYLPHVSWFLGRMGVSPG